MTRKDLIDILSALLVGALMSSPFLLDYLVRG